MLFTSDDGESLYNIPDNIYVADISEVHFTGLQDGTEVVKETPFSVKLDKKGKPVMRKGKIAGGAKAGRVELFREMSDFRRAGDTLIVLGMSQGPFAEEGYTGEIHELYIYEKIK